MTFKYYVELLLVTQVFQNGITLLLLCINNYT